MPRRRLVLVFGALLLAACSSHHEPPSLTTNVGRFRISVTSDTAKITIAGPDGAPLLEGIEASDDVGTPQSARDDAPPMTGFAIRDVTTTYTMLFGAFSLKDDTPPWRVAKKARFTGDNGAIDLLDPSGARLARMALSTEGDDAHLVADLAPGDGAPAATSGGPVRRISWGFRCNDQDRFFGFGAQTWGIDARKQTIPLWVSEEGIGKDLTTDDPTGAWFLVGRHHSTGFPMPEFLSRRGFVAVAETDHLSTFALCSERGDVARMELELPVKVHLFYGPSPKEAIERATGKFGRPRVPPAFAFAPWNDAIYGSTNVRAVAKEIRDAKIPSSVIWSEDWRGGGFDQADSPNHYALKEEWDVDRTLYPDFENVASELHHQGFKWLVYFNPFVQQGSRVFDQADKGGLLVKKADGTTYLFSDAKQKPSSYVDFTNPAAMDWAVGKMKDAMVLGADGFMGDYGEWLPTDCVLQGGRGLDVHNRYPLLWQTAQRRALDEAMANDGVERLSFVRSGWLGTAPLIDVFWPGDQRTNFAPDDGMPNVIPMGLGAGLAGVSTYGADIAGYQNATNGPSTKELFFRWTELGAWSPVMRTHHGSYPKLNWSFDKDAETLAHWAHYARLHVSLAPYLRALAEVAHEHGISIWRALMIDFPSDQTSWEIGDEMMVGDGILVAPVEVEGAEGRDVYLPPGTWFRWSDGTKMTGGKHVQVDASVGEIPVFARAGAIVPTYPDGVETLTREPGQSPSVPSAEQTGSSRVVYVFAGASGTFTETSDEGLAYVLTNTRGGDASASAPTWNGSPLAACTANLAPPCAEISASVVRAHVTGSGTLVVAPGTPQQATFQAGGGDPSRALTIVLRAQ